MKGLIIGWKRNKMVQDVRPPPKPLTDAEKKEMERLLLHCGYEMEKAIKSYQTTGRLAIIVMIVGFVVFIWLLLQVANIV